MNYLNNNQYKEGKLYETTNYDMFKFVEWNRGISTRQINALKRSIQINNMLSLNPIIVDREFNVIDGQHRLTVAKEMQVPIYFIIGDVSHSDMINLNTSQRNWQQIDYINYYAKQGDINYEKLKYIIDNNTFTITEVTILLDRDGKKEMLSKGHYIIHNEYEVNRRLNLLKKVKSLYGDRLYQVQCIALKIALDHKEFKINHFLKNLERNTEKFRAAAKVIEQVRVIEDIYNYRLQRSNHIRIK